MKAQYFLLFFFNYCVADLILVTGGAGFIGGHLAQELLRQGHSVIALDVFFSIPHGYADWYKEIRFERSQFLKAQYPHHFKIIEGNLVDRDLIEKIFAEHTIDSICHVAGLSNVRYSLENPLLYVAYNIEGTINLLSLMKKYHVRHIVMASSSSVYGDHLLVPFIESDNTETMKSPYAISKKAMELYGSLYHKLYGIDVTCLRLFTVYGPYGRMDMAPFLFIDAVNRGQEVVIMGNGEAKRDFTFVTDVVQAFIKALERPLGFQVFNIGSGSVITINDFISTIERVTNKKAIKRYQTPHECDVVFTQANIQKAYDVLDYQPLVTCDQGLNALNEWYQKSCVKSLYYKKKIGYISYDEYE